jgi:hypothetical protein
MVTRGPSGIVPPVLKSLLGIIRRRFWLTTLSQGNHKWDHPEPRTGLWGTALPQLLWGNEWEWLWAPFWHHRNHNLPSRVTTLSWSPMLCCGVTTHKLLVAVMSNSSQPSSEAHTTRVSSKNRSESLKEKKEQQGECPALIFMGSCLVVRINVKVRSYPSVWRAMALCGMTPHGTQAWYN